MGTENILVPDCIILYPVMWDKDKIFPDLGDAQVTDSRLKNV